MKVKKLKPKTLNSDELDEIMMIIKTTQGHLGSAYGAMCDGPENNENQMMQAYADNDANESLQMIYDIIFTDEESRKEGEEYTKMLFGIKD